MYQYEEIYERPRAFPLVARPLTFDQACLEAKQQLCALGWNLCATATCQDVVNKLCSDCTIFTGQNADRLALTGSYNCPVSPCPAAGAGGGGVDVTTILIFAGVAVAGAVVIGMLRERKAGRVMVARTRTGGAA